MTKLHLTAVILLKRGQPLPVDLQTSLMEEGVNVDAFIRHYSI